MPRLPLRAAGVSLLLVGLLTGFGYFHLHLKSSFPAKEEVLNDRPARVQLWFSETPEIALTRIALTGPGDATVALGKVTADTNHSVLATVPDALPEGTYTVRWQTGSTDGHPVRGTFAFTYSTTQPASAGAADGGPSHSHR